MFEGRAPPALLARRLDAHENRLFAALGGAMCFSLLRTAYRVGLFRLLHERPGLRRDEIAAALGLSAYATEVLLLGLVPMKLVVRIDRGYHNDPWLSGLLSGALDDGGLGKIIEYFHHVINPAMEHLEGAVRGSRPLGLERLFGEGGGSFYEALGRDPVRGAYFHAAMAADTALNRDRIASNRVFAGCRRLLDVGGNEGELAIAIAARHPEIRITVLDFPEVAARATARFSAEGLEGRLDAIGVDLREPSFPPGYDGVVFAHFLDIFSPDKVRGLLTRAHECLSEGGAVMVFGSVMRDDETGPLTYGVLSSYFLCLADGEGRFYTAKQTADAMVEVGFADVEEMVLPRGEVFLRAVKPRSGAQDAGRASPRAKLAALVDLGRPRFLVYSLLFYGLGSAAVAHEGRPIHLGSWLHGLGFVWCAHLMTHYCNEYFDLAADRANLTPTRWTGGSRVLVNGRLSPVASLAAAFVLLFAALSLALAMPSGGPRWLAFGTLALAWFYTAPPLRLNHRGLGEVAVAAVLNLAVPLVAYGLQRGGGASPALVGALLPIFVLQAARMLAMNLSDRRSDALAGKRTLAVALGARWATAMVALGQAVAYGSVVVLMMSHVLPVAVGAAMLVTLPLSVWQTLRLLSGALEDTRQADSVVFWASTHVALVGAAAMIGLLAPVSPALSAVVLLACVVAVGLQIRRDRVAVRP